ncbi:coactosin-like protein isoform X2 [Anoplophora glabripennis]|nr:coactosin-like protein isoform X2 [Anoplophora glabripennis]
MSTSMDIESVRAAYDDVRSDSSETQWAVLKFDGSKIAPSATGADFGKFKEQFSDNERAFGYIRVQTGDEMSKRQKFLFVTWVGPLVSVLQRAKMSTDKAVVKNVISNFAVELQVENTTEIDLKNFVNELNKAGGANYGTGVREI